MTDRVAHLPDLTIAAFTNDERQQPLRAGVAGEASQQTDRRRRRLAPIDHEAARETLEEPRFGNAADDDFVLALDAVTRMRELRREIAVARQQQKSFRVVVEPADGIDVLANAALREQIDDRRPLLRIGSARDVAARFVEEDVAEASWRLDPSSIDA